MAMELSSMVESSVTQPNKLTMQITARINFFIISFQYALPSNRIRFGKRYCIRVERDDSAFAGKIAHESKRFIRMIPFMRQPIIADYVFIGMDCSDFRSCSVPGSIVWYCSIGTGLEGSGRWC